MQVSRDMMCLDRRLGSKKSVLLQRSVTVAAIQEVVLRSSGQCVVAGFIIELYGIKRSSGVQHVVTSATPQFIATAAAVYRVVAVLAVESVAARTVKD